MKFCPMCGTMLLLQVHIAPLKFSCSTCPYFSAVVDVVRVPVELPAGRYSKELATEIVDSAGEQKEKTGDVSCPFCDHDEAYVMKSLDQFRSGDEPTSNTYKCTNPLCGKEFRDSK